MQSGGSLIGFIGGSGFDTALEDELGPPLRASETVGTEYGSAIVTIYETPNGTRIAFVPRHGLGHIIAPHLINHHANIATLRALGCRFALSTTAVGSLRRELRPGDLAVPDDFLDFRGGPATTLYNTIGTVAHTDFSEPFSPPARNALLAAATAAALANYPQQPDTIIHPRATYLCVSGPRYETPAEVRCFASWGADIVGMTAAPEAILSREHGLGYATLAVVTNYGTGISPDTLSHAEVEAMMHARRGVVLTAMIAACSTLAAQA